MKNSAQICLDKYDISQFLREIQAIRGDKNQVSFGTILDAVQEQPDQFPYLTENFFHRSRKWARNQITQMLDKRCGIPQRNKKRGTMAVYLFQEEE